MAMLSHETQNHNDDKADGAAKKIDFLTFLHSQEKLTVEEANSHATDIMMGGVETVRLSMKAAIIMHTHTHTHTLTHTHRCRGKLVMPIFIDLQKTKEPFLQLSLTDFNKIYIMLKQQKDL